VVKLWSDYAYLIVGLPVLAFVLTIFFGWHLPRGGGFFTVGATALGFIISAGIFTEIFPEKILHQSDGHFRMYVDSHLCSWLYER
jgi:NADH-quinone oxidoreductase subunit L